MRGPILKASTATSGFARDLAIALASAACLVAFLGACAGDPSPTLSVGQAQSPSAPSELATRPEFSSLRRASPGSIFRLVSLHEPPTPIRPEQPLVPGRRKPLAKGLVPAALPEPTAPAKKMPAVEVLASEPALVGPSQAADPASAPPAAASPAPPAPAASPASAAAKPDTAKPEAKAAPRLADPVVGVPVPGAPASIAPLFMPETGQKLSRSVAAEEGGRVELPFEGTGWTFLGEKGGSQGVAYYSRRIEGANVTFVISALAAGEYLLRFQRQDAARGIAYDELVALSVKPRPKAGAPSATAAASAAASPASAAVVVSPNAPTGAASPNSPAGVGSPATASPNAPTGVGSPAAVSPNAPTGAAPFLPDAPEALLRFAKGELDAGRVPGAVEALDRLLQRYPAGLDEAFFLYARALEQNGPQKDLRRAYAFYRKVRDEYPLSPFWDRAAERVSYIERHYFDIR